MKKALTSAFLSMFCTEMSLIFRSGIALSDGVRVLLSDADKSSTIVLNSILDELSKGKPFSVAIENSGYFPSHMIGVVKAGEKTGRIVEMLGALSDYYDRLDRVAVTIKNAVLFPLVLLAVIVGVIFILITQVLPIFNDVYGRHGVRMSPLANSFMRFGQWLNGVSLIIAIVLGIIFAASLLLRVIHPLRARLLKISREWFGGIWFIAETASYHFLSVMTLSVESGLKTKEAVELASAVSGGTKSTDRKNAECLKLISEGATLAEAMGGAGILSLRETQMLSFGIRGGETDLTMAEIMRRKERNLLDRINRIISLIEPSLIILISVIVAIVLLSVMAPLLGILSSISG